MHPTARLLFISAILVLVLPIAPASADCYIAGTAAVRMECQKEFLFQANEYLNKTYSALMEKESAVEKAELRSGQRAWLKERDLVCALAPGQTSRTDWTTTILADSGKSDCVIEKTFSRAGFLAFILGQHGAEAPSLPHADDGELYSETLKPGMRLDDYLKALRKNYDDLDADKDGVISASDFRSGNARMFAMFMGKEAQASDRVTWDNVVSRGTAYFGYFDKDKDGIVSADEFDLVRELELVVERGGTDDIKQDPECDLPKPSPEAEIVLLSAYETKALASVGMHGSEVRAGLIKIAPGDRPLYVILPTYRPTIWTFEGNVDRVQLAVLTSMDTAPNSSDPKDGPPLAGAIGLKQSQVFFPPNVHCMQHFDTHPSYDSISRIEALKRQFGRLPDVVSATYSVAGFSIPEGAILQPDESASALGWRNLRSRVGLFYPGGVVPIDPAQVVSSQKVETYNVLPGVAGLRQLVEQGALVPLEGHATYRVTRKITLPAGLYGASLATFIVPKGVPLPEGDPGHSCVKSEDGKSLAGSCNLH